MAGDTAKEWEELGEMLDEHAAQTLAGIAQMASGAEALGRRADFLLNGIIAMATKARGVGRSTIPVEAVDNLLARYAKEFISE